jgi:NADH-quinone oxidoreductase subunit C
MSKSNDQSLGNIKSKPSPTVASNKDLPSISPKQGETGSIASPPPKPSSDNTSVQLKSEEADLPQFEKGIIDSLVSKYGDSVKVIYVKPLRIKIEVPSKDIVEIARHIRDESGFDHAESVCATDYPKTGDIEVIYHLGSYTRDDLSSHILSLSTRTDRNNARLPSLIGIFKSVEYHERESFEMVGVYFDNHPRNDRFLLPEDWADIPPLRKEFRIKGR